MCWDILIAKLGASISPITGNVLQPYDDIIGHLFGFSYSEIQQLMIYLVVKAAMMQATINMDPLCAARMLEGSW